MVKDQLRNSASIQVSPGGGTKKYPPPVVRMYLAMASTRAASPASLRTRHTTLPSTASPAGCAHGSARGVDVPDLGAAPQVLAPRRGHSCHNMRHGQDEPWPDHVSRTEGRSAPDPDDAPGIRAGSAHSPSPLSSTSSGSPDSVRALSRSVTRCVPTEVPSAPPPALTTPNRKAPSPQADRRSSMPNSTVTSSTDSLIGLSAARRPWLCSRLASAVIHRCGFWLSFRAATTLSDD